ncbi:carcinoembryonic antigen-related cell adhesion molecule 6-like isoform X2 [Acanthopagrus latus]|uniref:carcinoembryonic antigen-related cell adhesion molecule 6-like isoform X2 n=1 Tax=Acanthopagrus latus TaxID=8177 RepID=UPI00187BED08|nr:carcinoembryonic antigen-related cell adhesion molecule 6-like isoform X2 [Acanthopagrus latus]
MCVNLSLMLMLLFLSGAVCSERKVTYQQHICAVKGSSVVIPCSFYYPENLQVKKVMWGHEKSNIFDGPFIFESEMNETASRFQYIGDKEHNCSFKIHDVEKNDAGKYAFRFMTNDKSSYTGTAGSTLKVIDLNVSMMRPNDNRVTKEGDSVNLTCINGCDSDHLSSAFTWFKNGEPKNEGPVLYLSNMNPTDSGNYSCSLKTHTGTASRVININVEYAPKNTSVSGRPLMEVEAGTNITLICSSHANPPVDYTWFKIDESHVLDVGHQPELFTADGGQYFCIATNKHGRQYSSVVTVKIKERWPSFNRDVLIITLSVAVLLIVIAAVAVMKLKTRPRAEETNCEEDSESQQRSQGRSKKKRTRAEETNCEEDREDAVYANMTVMKKQSKGRRQGEGATGSSRQTPTMMRKV